MNWAGLALSRVQAGEPTALITVVEAEGSTPRERGARMLVGEHWSGGSIGGGNLEWRATEQARRLLRQETRDYAVQDYPLGPMLKQCCGGRVRLLLERIDAASRDWLEQADQAMRAGATFTLEAEFGTRALTRRVRFEDDQWPGLLASSSIRLVPRSADAAADRRATPRSGDRLLERIAARRPSVVVFGAGHVGLAVARAFAPLPFDFALCDLRPEAAAAGVEILDQAALVRRAASGADFTLIMTHSHDLDYLLVRAALGGGGYVGLIGSATKRARFLSRLRADGFSEAAMARLTCPIGLPALKNKAPEVIAVSVAADLLQRSEGAE